MRTRRRGWPPSLSAHPRSLCVNLEKMASNLCPTSLALLWRFLTCPVDRFSGCTMSEKYGRHIRHFSCKLTCLASAPSMCTYLISFVFQDHEPYALYLSCLDQPESLNSHFYHSSLGWKTFIRASSLNLRHQALTLITFIDDLECSGDLCSKNMARCESYTSKIGQQSCVQCWTVIHFI